ncbi:hypothetical protein [Chitinophaga sp. MM2321]|uniref:hypothetical protein n=1 Tax=Chitinophaga sp. MM2321 TaxID=3137178 RepID=UPI0032D57313
MAKYFRQAWLFTRFIYTSSEKAVIGNSVLHTEDTYEQARIRLVFDYIFFYLVLLMPIMFIAMISQNEINMLLIPLLAVILFGCLLLLRKGASTKKAASVASLSTLGIPILSSFFNNQDLSPKYAVIWAMSILLAYIAVNLRTSLVYCLVLAGYLSVVAYIKLHHIHVYVSPGHSAFFQYAVNPVIVVLYMLLLIRTLGQYYRNIISMEQRRTAAKHKQHLSLINQNLTKQFLLVKGFSSSGRSAFMNGEMELLEACFTEIEKQCGTAISYLEDAQEN